MLLRLLVFAAISMMILASQDLVEEKRGKKKKDSKKKPHNHKHSSCSSSSSNKADRLGRKPIQMYPSPIFPASSIVPCTNCGCAEDVRFGCDSLVIPLRTLPSGCGIPTAFFTGKKVLVIGATSGIGASTAQLFQFYGALVVGTSRDPPTKGAAFTWPLMKLDVGIDESVDCLVREYCEKYGGPPDILIDNGARAVFGMAADIGDDWENYAHKNMASGHIRLIKAFIKRLPFNKANFISLSTVSAAAYYSLPGSTLYTSAKQHLRQFIQNWGWENSRQYPNVFLGFIAPPFTRTNFARNAHYVNVLDNPLTAGVRRLYMNLVAGGIEPIWVARAFAEVAYMRAQGQTCDIGYLAVDPSNAGTDIEFNSQLTNAWSNKVPIDYGRFVGSYFSAQGLAFQYNTTFLQCPQTPA